MIRRLFLPVPVVLLALSLAAPAFSQTARTAEDEALEASIRELIEVTNTRQIAERMLDQIFEAYEKIIPEVPKEAWPKFRADMKTSDFVDLVVPIYAKHFTRQDIEGLIGFYKSPLGRKVSEKQGVIAQECMAAGILFGQEVARKVLEELVQRGYQVSEGSGI
jgi:hypothetical protein